MKPPRLREGSAGRAPTLRCIPSHLPYNWGKITDKLQSGYPQGARLISAERDSFSRLRHGLAMASSGLLSPTALGFRVRRRGSTLGQRRSAPSCRNRGFLTSANFESKLAVRALMWSANSGTPRSSWICVLLTYQGASVARRRHRYCSTCSLRMWVRAADIHAEPHNPSWRGWAAYTARLRSWWTDHFFCSGWDSAYPSFEQFSSWPDRCRATRWAMYLPDNELSTHWIGSPKSVIGRGWMKRRLSRCSSRHLWRFSIHSATVEGPWDRIPGSWQAASAYGTWLWWPCRPSRGPNRRGVRGCWHVVDIQTEKYRVIKPPCATPARMPRRDEVDVWKAASNVRPRRNEMGRNRQDGKFRIVSL